MNKLTKILLISLIMNFILIASVFAIGYSERIEVLKDKTVGMYFNGHKLSLKDSNTGEKYYPLIYKDRTYIPVRAFLNVIGVDVDWNEDYNMVMFETEYDVVTGRKMPDLGTWYKEKYYEQIEEERNNAEEKEIETVYYNVDAEIVNIPKINNILLSNKESATLNTEWLGKSKDYLREYIFISEPLIFKEKTYNHGHDLEYFYNELLNVLKEQGFSFLEENYKDGVMERKYIKSDMNMYVIKSEQSVTLKIIKGTIVDR